MTSLLMYVVVVVVGGCALLFLVAYWYQSHLLYIPDNKEFRATPADIGLNYEEIRLTTRDQVTIHGWLVSVDKPRGVILFCHGNAGNISHRLDSLQLLANLGFSIFIFDYRGYGKSEGKPTEEGTYLDAQAAYDYLLGEKGEDPKRIVLFGRSLGVAVASYIGSRYQCGALILESGFTSVPELAQQLYPFLPEILLTKFSYNSVANLKDVVRPTLIVHSKDDEMIPFSHGRKLYEAANEPKRFLEMKGGHNDGFYVTGKPYFDGLDQFLRENI